ncbi:MAG: class I SAM-dependent RNA methyltransferase [Janthinobacterium lividum]
MTVAGASPGWVDIVRLGTRGDGVTADGRFVPVTVPGDRVRFADPVEVAAGPDHATPPCRHFPDCGGCQLQHVTDSAYERWAVARIVAALDIVGVAVGRVEPFALSPPRSRRRASLRAVRRGGALTLGFNADASHRIVDMHECHVLTPGLFALVAPLRALLRAALKDGEGAGITLTESDSGVDVLLANVAARSLADIERLNAFAAAHDLARLSVEGAEGVETVTEARPPVLRFGGVGVVLPPAPFLQATRAGEAALQAAVAAATAGAQAVADLFSGLGTFALPLSAGARVLAVDSSASAAAALAAAARAAGRTLLVEPRDLFRRPLAPAELARFDAVVFDPPRAGAAAQVAALAASAVPRVVAVSCNPGSFARDAAVLAAGGYRLERLWPVGQFRWSSHVELAAQFSR